MKLYRYRKANLDFLRTEILKDEFYLWSLNDQNDPFEGRLLYKNNISLESILDSFKKLRNELKYKQVKWKDWLIPEESRAFYDVIKNSSDAKLELIAKKSFLRGDYDLKGIQLIKEGYQKMTDNVVMSCFSSKKNNPVMFAHYADNHRGVCLEYEVDLRDFFKVEYVEDFPKLNLLNSEKELVMKYRTHTKHKDWEYENEYRLLLYNRKPGVYSNERIKLKSIYLGINSTIETREGIKNMLINKKEKISLFSLSVGDEKYELNTVKID